MRERGRIDGVGAGDQRIAQNTLDELVIPVDISGIDLGVDAQAIIDTLNVGGVTPQAALEAGIDAYGPQRFTF